MQTQHLSNDLLYQSFLLGAENVIREKNTLNAINVFPVPDSDTGTNLAAMMRSIITHAKQGKTPKETMESIADAAIMGARGNSGIIFAEYIHGFAADLPDDEVGVDSLITVAHNAAKKAYHAISKPVEGTIITLMRTWAGALDRLKGVSNNLIDLLAKAYDVVLQELDRTPEMLPVLKENNVVDAGAKGFVHFLEGFARALRGETLSEDLKIDQDKPVIHVEHLEASQTRYCTEALLRGKDLNVDQIRHMLESFGDSVVVAGSDRMLRVHVHTDQPDEIFAGLEPYGQILEQKVDDMRRQFEAANQRKYDIALVTDSIADLPQSMIDQYQIHMIPIGLTINDVNYFDKVTIQSSRFYGMMDSLKVYPTSSLPNEKTLEDFFSFLTTHYKTILVMTVSSQMSGTNQVFQKVAAKFPETDIKVIDSRQNSGAQGLLVMTAAKLIEEGLPVDEIASRLEDLRQKTRILVSVQTLKYMVRSGRLSKVSGLMGKVLNLKPVVSIDDEGKGIIFAKALSIKKSNRLIEAHMREMADKHGIETYAIVHANADKRAAEYARIYENMLGKQPAYIMDISTIVAMNAGIGTVAIAYIRKD
ncbi:MAG: DegV family EDD domain-containing protein [Acholeplasmataceae bacterium]|nr:MAG: DegV family EDD domain-containing protein [Acholeplasmataceae bacterium]